MRSVSLGLLLLMASGASNAGLADSLRELRGTMSEITNTSREAGALNKEVGPASSPNTQMQQSSSGGIQSGDALVGKIANLKIYKEANKKSALLMLASKSDDLIYMGEESDGLYRVTTPKGEGWVDKLLVKKN